MRTHGSGWTFRCPRNDARSPSIASLLAALPLILLSLGATSGWVQDGALLAGGAANQAPRCVVPDGAGGAFFVCATAGGPAQLLRVTATGSTAAGWPAAGVPVGAAGAVVQEPALIADGSGGVLVAWVGGPDGADIVASRYGADGARPAGWPAGGVAVCTSPGEQRHPRMVPDGAGGAIIAWEDGRAGLLGAGGTLVYAQRVLAGGQLAWTANGIPVHPQLTEQMQPQLAPDAAHGAFVLWLEASATAGARLACQHLGASGALQWGADGVQLATAPAGGVLDTGYQLAPDGAGGAFAFWSDIAARPGAGLVQRISAAGTLPWGAQPVAVTPRGAWPVVQAAVPDARRGVLLAWADSHADAPRFRMYAQRVDSTGAPQWSPGGIAVCAAAGNQDAAAVAGDGVGGMFVAWQAEISSSDTSSTGTDIQIQHVGPNGLWAAGWDDAGSVVCAARGHQLNPQLVVDSTGAVILGWEDWRNLKSSGIDAYVGQEAPRSRHLHSRRTGSFDTLGTGGDSLSPEPPRPFAFRVSPTPSRGRIQLVFESAAAAPVRLRLYSVSGRLLREAPALNVSGAGRTLRWDPAATGGALPAGTYFLVGESGGKRARQKILLFP